MPTPHGGMRPLGLDQKGHIVGHQLGGSDQNINNFFAQDWFVNTVLFKTYEGRVNKELDKGADCFLVLGYSVSLKYPDKVDLFFPLRPNGLLSAGVFTNGSLALGYFYN